MTHGTIALRAVEREEEAGLLPGMAGRREAVTVYVHSVFRSTVNIADERGLFLSLGNRSSMLAPRMAIIDRDLDFTGLDPTLKPGKIIEIIGHSLLLSDRVRCDLSAARATSLAIPRVAAVDSESLSAAVTVLTESLKLYGKPGGAGRPWLRYASGSGALDTLHEQAFYRELIGLSRLMHDGGEQGLYENAAGLVGMGIGLTPTADDFLTGFFGTLLAARAACRDWAELNRDRWLESVAGNTTFLGFEMLKQALEGKVNQAALNVIQACFGSDRRSLEVPITRLLELGSTSGTDMLAGIAFGLTTLQVWKRRERQIED